MDRLETPPFEIPDVRRPGQPMASFPLKLPVEAVLKIQVMADQMGTSKTAFVRALVLKKLAELEPLKAPPAHPNPKPSDSVRVRGSDQCENFLSAENYN